MDRIRLISFFLAISIYIAMMFPTTGLIIFGFILALFFIYTFINAYLERTNRRGDSKTNARTHALKTAKPFLAPYTNIWRNLKLSNKYCSIRLNANGKTITVREILRSSDELGNVLFIDVKNVKNYDLWNVICLNFNNETTYYTIKDFCNEEMIFYTDQSSSKKRKISSTVIEKTDINNASEIELTALPGISIVLSKKIIKKREEIGGFKSVNDFFVFMKLKPHMEQQLQDLICVNKMKGSLKIERFQERSIDL